jgi:putative transcriptional regulator
MLFPEIFHRLERARWSLDADIPWDQFDRSKLTERQLHGIKMNAIAEWSAMPTAEMFLRDNQHDVDFSAFMSIWFFEEQKHSLTLLEYLHRFTAIHETMEALHEVGALDKQTLREFDEACLSPIRPMSPEDIRALREREHLSQPVFARYLNVSKNLVSDWERGVKKPGGPALRLLTVIEKSGIQAIA